MTDVPRSPTCTDSSPEATKRMNATLPWGVQVGWMSHDAWPSSHCPSHSSGLSANGCETWRGSDPSAFITNTAEWRL